MLLNHRLFIESTLGGKISKINSIGSVCDGRLTCNITIAGNKKYFIKIYSHKNKELYLREKSVLAQFVDSVVPKLLIADDKRQIIITRYLDSA